MIIPSRKDFYELARKGNMVSVYTELFADMDTPVSLYHKIIKSPEKTSRYSFLLESVEGGENIARYSFIGTGPQALLVQKNGTAEFIKDGTGNIVEGKDIFDKLQNVLRQYRPAGYEELPPNIGGAVGYISYDLISEVEKSVRSPDRKPYDIPEAMFMIADTILVYDKVKHTVKIISQAFTGERNGLDKVYDAAVARIEQLAKILQSPSDIQSAQLARVSEIYDYSSNKTKDEFCRMVERTKQYILDGDIIQAVLSQRFSIRKKVSPLALYRALRIVNPSPYMFLLDCGDFSIVGASPEVHAKCIDGKITVRPIAGTRRRGNSREDDLRLEAELLDDTKEKAEHIMLVDLARNDIGRVAGKGTVKVDNLMFVERYSHVMHIVSEVTGILDPELEPDCVMRSTFPAGTLSGAPKVRAMQIISEQEGERRGAYGGAVAYYSFSGNIDSCITIRTAVIKDDIVYIQSGAGIVADSVPEKEYEETVNKAKALMKAIGLSELFET